jgi:transposase
MDFPIQDLSDLRHRLQARAQAGSDRTALEDTVVEADEMYQNAGEKGVPHEDPEDPPQHRANKVRGHGTMDNDRPPVLGVVGRETDQIRLDVVEHSDQKTLNVFVVDMTERGAMVNTDEWAGYDRLPVSGRGRAAVCHAPGRREWARDDDGDGVREVHDNALDGSWTGLRNFLRPFRGVNKLFFINYADMLASSNNLKEATAGFLRAVLGIKVVANVGP